MADDELYRRWQVARLTEPLHRLEIRSATKADFDHARYDLVQLALRAIDYVVTHQASMTGTVTPDELVAHLAGLARRLAPGAVVAEVRRSQEVHTRLERLIVGAIPVYLNAQQAQRFTPRASALAVDLVQDVLTPYLEADEGRAGEAADALAGRLAVRRLPAWTLDDLAAVLLRPPALYEPPKPVWDDPGALDEPEEQGLPADVEAAASAVFRACHAAPHRLSELVALGAHHGAEVPTATCSTTSSTLPRPGGSSPPASAEATRTTPARVRAWPPCWKG